MPPSHIPALCRLLSDATHSVHYNKAVVCRAGSVQQGDKVLPLYQKQLQRGEKVSEQEISSFEFSLSLPSSSQTGTANSLLSAFFHQLVVPAGICIAVSGEHAGCMSGGSSPRGPWPQAFAHRAVGDVCPATTCSTVESCWLGRCGVSTDLPCTPVRAGDVVAKLGLNKPVATTIRP